MDGLRSDESTRHRSFRFKSALGTTLVAAGHSLTDALVLLRNPKGHAHALNWLPSLYTIPCTSNPKQLISRDFNQLVSRALIDTLQVASST